MVQYAEQDIVPLDRARLWKFLDLHLDNSVIVQIHPDIVGQTLLSSRGNETTVERQIRFLGSTRRSVWKLTYDRPDRARWEIIESKGPMAQGSYLENTYSDDPGGTLIQSEGDIRVTTLPGFMQRGVVNGAMNSIGKQDLAYLKAHPI
ncbi:MAG: hypothetical protein L3K17_00510 [Thermoplasmata archaeon]|nr:hypothetical protein [Thermoplasmata archaeon]